MQKFLKYNINVPTVQQQDQSKARVVIEPLEIGYGHTLGNALRRICLSSIPGAAMFAVKFANHAHEFETIVGVKEDITNIILNLKSLAISINTEMFSEEYFNDLIIDKWPKMVINFKGPGVVTANDIITPVGFEVINKDLVIAEVTEKVDFQVDIFAKLGRGRVDFSTNKDYISTLHIIPTDSNYSPVVHYKYDVQTVKDSKYSNSEILTIDIATNGTISGADALAVSAKILQEHLTPIININERINELVVTKEKEQEEKKTSSSIPIDDLELSVRAYNALKQSGINSTSELIEMNKWALEKIKNLGRKSVLEIIEKLKEHGLELKND
ncbi:DNA-directed RNA polymerase subunit alpha [Ureaplasma sp. ES3154-GEN]|uniref:DNA-directed RNA polymerase subunit alpha n=1 Tax=Ureaplasma sp. ES3154-GEN TaxID=2984844 RepID=UPI0021E91D32|nr:DNA-directed RNA polymerase subunit alpha [Ureaplasma sp. ES3154-GEN]MCV3743630.1 DNA-directed RNA polymerase subunit alpha [Ureaplasma sp. ES3154-GEN]